MTQVFNKLKNLLNGTPESFYWLGFILADGYLSNINRMKVTQCEKDKDQVYKLQKFLGVGNVRIEEANTNFGKTKSWCLSVMDKATVSTLKERYNISNNKTYIPPNLSGLTEEELFCVMMGYSDGDGSVRLQTGRTDCVLSVKAHSSWKETFELLYDQPAKINKQGYAYIAISDNEKLRRWKRKALCLELPISERKWGMVDEGRESKYSVTNRRVEQIEALYAAGLSKIEISQKIGVTPGAVYRLFRKGRIKCQKS